MGTRGGRHIWRGKDGGKWQPPRKYTRRCKFCGSLFTGVWWQRYCNAECRGRANEQKRRWGHLKRLTKEQARDYTVVALPASEKDPTRIYTVVIPLTPWLEHRLTQLTGYTVGDLDRVIGGLLPHPGGSLGGRPSQTERRHTTPDGYPITMSRRTQVAHDALLWGLNSLIQLARGRRVRLPRRLTLMQKIVVARAKAEGKDPTKALYGLRGAEAKHHKTF